MNRLASKLCSLFLCTDAGLTKSIQQGKGELFFNATAIAWDAYNLAEKLLTQPLLVIVGSKPGAFGAYRDGFEIVRRAASIKKELVVVRLVAL